MAQGVHQVIKVPRYQGGSFASGPAVEARMKVQRRRDTGPELALRKALHRKGLRYQLHQRPVPSLRREADIVFPGSRVAVFMNGCFWHGCPEHGRTPRANTWYWAPKLARNQQRDAETDAALDEAGWLSMRVWEHEDPAVAAEQIAEHVRARRRSRARTATGATRG